MILYRTLGIETTNICNFNCIHCYMDDNKKSLNYNRIVNFLESLPVDFLEVYLSGGECHLAENFIDLYQFLIKKGYLVTILTNGSILTPKHLKMYQEYKPLKLEISIYGMSKYTYYSVTKNINAFDAVFNNIKKLKKFSLHLKYCLLKQNAQELPFFLEYVRKGAYEYSISPQIIPKLNGDLSPLNCRIEPNEIAIIFNENNLPIKVSDNNSHICDLGNNLFIDANEIVRGCPILRTDFDVSIENMTASEFRKYMKKLSDIRENDNYLCTGWSTLEGEDNVKKFVKVFNE